MHLMQFYASERQWRPIPRRVSFVSVSNVSKYISRYIQIYLKPPNARSKMHREKSLQISYCTLILRVRSLYAHWSGLLVTDDVAAVDNAFFVDGGIDSEVLQGTVARILDIAVSRGNSFFAVGSVFVVVCGFVCQTFLSKRLQVPPSHTPACAERAQCGGKLKILDKG